MITARSAWYKSMDNDGNYVSLKEALKIIDNLSKIGVFTVTIKNLTLHAIDCLILRGFDVQTYDVETSITWYDPKDGEE